jgi:hypothetical protein
MLSEVSLFPIDIIGMEVSVQLIYQLSTHRNNYIVFIRAGIIGRNFYLFFSLRPKVRT